MARRRPVVLDACSQADKHTEGPDGYVAWHEWAEHMSKTHIQSRCPGCGYWKIWTQETPK